MSNTWHKVWSKRSLPATGSVVERLIAADGFDSPLGYMAESDWRDYLALFAERAGIRKGDSLFEVGCGSGAFLFPFFEQGYAVAGIDYSAELIAIAREVMPSSANALSVMEAAACPTTPMADVVFSNHVIHYFRDIAYAGSVLDRMFAKSARVVAVSGVPDVALKAESERERRGLLSDEEYDRKYRGLEILYYDRAWLEGEAARRGFDARFHPHAMPGFAQNRFRFDCVMTRREAR